MVKQKTDVSKIIEKGKKQGFLTQDDILAVFPDAEDRLDELDDLYFRLIEEDVDVFDAITEEEIKDDEKAATALAKELEVRSLKYYSRRSSNGSGKDVSSRNWENSASRCR